MRETGVIRLHLGNTEREIDAGKVFVGVARTQLGMLKNAMRLGGLMQGSNSRTLPDGTTIRVASVFGQDYVSIAASVPTAPHRAVPQAPVVTDEPVVVEETVREKTKRTSIEKKKAVESYTRLTDGPAKFGHEAVFDLATLTMWIWGGYDRELPVLDPQSDVPPTYHYTSDIGQYVSQQFDWGGSYPSVPWNSTYYNSAGITYSGPYSRPNTLAGEENAIADAGHGTGWTRFGVVYSSVPVTDYYGNVSNSGELIEFRIPDVTSLAVYTTFVGAHIVWDTYGTPSNGGGTARFYDTTDSVDSTFSGYRGNGGGYWRKANNNICGYEYALASTEMYESEDPDGWQNHNDAFRRDITALPGGSGLAPKIDLLPSNSVWSYSVSTGVWTDHGVLSYTDWQTYRSTYNFGNGSDIWSSSLANTSAARSPGNSAASGTTYVWWETGTVGTASYRYYELEFGGTTRASPWNRTNPPENYQVAELWLYKYEAAVTSFKEIEE